MQIVKYSSSLSLKQSYAQLAHTDTERFILHGTNCVTIIRRQKLTMILHPTSFIKSNKIRVSSFKIQN